VLATSIEISEADVIQCRFSEISPSLTCVTALLLFQTERMHNYKAISQTAVALSASNRAKNRYVNVLPCILEEMILICFVVVRLTGFVTRI